MSDEGGSSGGHGGPVWLLTYCDLITLLVAFFVMLISFSTINVEKYKKDIPKIEESFDPTLWSARFKGIFEEGEMSKSEKPFSGRDGESLMEGGRNLLAALSEKDLQIEEESEMEDQSIENSIDSGQVYNYLSGFVKESGLAKYLDIEDVKIGCKIKIPVGVCFEKGESALKREAYGVFHELGVALKTVRGKIVVGINAGKIQRRDRLFTAETAMSLDRAANICDFLATKEKIEPQKIAIAGYHSAGAEEQNMVTIMIFKK
ncbi:flagellar motor protein MotB [Candidatus Brocadiaceae bacterium B188]|nr:hypothetical protein [Candidatus Brocadia sapporoensis]QQR67019.1 MAG: hypothetical protein IPI25_01865 [Candidatus Brocadia sp.]RZV58311.1 MAG: hypothetical protein EX330_06010 [Candidatus Brocadia sp. BROELEC01]TWU54019.1 flagellar motor protein MotB [Candidatus Brocadiaceae bacterium B188]